MPSLQIIPMVLVNGAAGIGMGWSTSIPNYNPLEIIDNLRRYLRGQKMNELYPWYKGFVGDMSEGEKIVGNFEARGIIKKVSSTQLEIVELPVKTWTTNYKEFLEKMLPSGVGNPAQAKKDKKKKEEEGAADQAAAAGDKDKDKDKAPKVDKDKELENSITDCREYHTENTVHFLLKLTEEQMAKAESIGLEKFFRLYTSISCTNMMAFDRKGVIRRYETANDIVEEFAIVRLEYYDKRRNYLIDKLGREKAILDAKVRFILLILEGALEIRNKKKAALVEELLALNFKPMSELNKGSLGTLPDAEQEGGAGEDHEPEQGGGSGAGAAASSSSSAGPGTKTNAGEFDYLVGMSMWTLTQEKVEELKKQLKEKSAELVQISKTTRESMWDEDLKKLRGEVEAVWDEDEQEEKKARIVAKDNRKKQQVQHKVGAMKKAGAGAGGKKGGGGAAASSSSSAGAGAGFNGDEEEEGFKPVAEAPPMQRSRLSAVQLSELKRVDLEERQEYVVSRYVSDRRDVKKPGKGNKLKLDMDMDDLIGSPEESSMSGYPKGGSAASSVGFSQADSELGKRSAAAPKKRGRGKMNAEPLQPALTPDLIKQKLGGRSKASSPPDRPSPIPEESPPPEMPKPSDQMSLMERLQLRRAQKDAELAQNGKAMAKAQKDSPKSDVDGPPKSNGDTLEWLRKKTAENNEWLAGRAAAASSSSAAGPGPSWGFGSSLGGGAIGSSSGLRGSSGFGGVGSSSSFGGATSSSFAVGASSLGGAPGGASEGTASKAQGLFDIMGGAEQSGGAKRRRKTKSKDDEDEDAGAPPMKRARGGGGKGKKRVIDDDDDDDE